MPTSHSSFDTVSVGGASAAMLNEPEPASVVGTPPEDRRQNQDEPIRDPLVAPGTGSDSSALSESDILQTLSILTSQYGAESILHWTITGRDESGNLQLQSTSSTQECPQELVAKIPRLVQQAFEKREVTAKLISSRKKYYIVVAPVPGMPGYAISATFPLNRLSDDGDGAEQRASMRLRCRDVALAAAHLSVVHLRSQIDQSHEPGNGSQTPESWKSLGLLAGSKLKATAKTVLDSRRKAFMCLAAIVCVGILPWPFQVACQVTCEPASRRYVACPFDGKLLESHVKPGDQVEQNQILARLDGSDLRSEIAVLSAKIAQASQRRHAAMSTGDASSAELERLELEQLRSEVAVLEKRQDNLEVRAPISGIVVSGNLEKATGSPLSMGEDLFEIAPLDEIIAEIAIPEADIAYITPGMSVRIVLESSAGRDQLAKIERIHPRNEIRENASVFIAEAQIANSGSHVRPGMTGNAKISTGWRPVAWILFHRPLESLRSTLGW